VRWAIIDTSVYIDYWERGLHDAALADVRKTFIIRQSAVVLSELRRGARTKAAQHLLQTLFGLARIQWAPTEADWWRAGLLIRELGDARRWDPHKRMAFQNDVLIALTARRHGATIVTANRSDFELLGRELGISVLAV
jgi:predicted nucleic acid-binding protein